MRPENYPWFFPPPFYIQPVGHLCCWLISLVFIWLIYLHLACHCCKSDVCLSSQLARKASYFFCCLTSWDSALSFIPEVAFWNANLIMPAGLLSLTSESELPGFKSHLCLVWSWTSSLCLSFFIYKKRKTIQIWPGKIAKNTLPSSDPQFLVP